MWRKSDYLLLIICIQQVFQPPGRVPYTRVNRRIRLFPKLQGNMRLLPNMHLIMKAKIDHTPKPWHLFGSTCTWQKSRVIEIVIVDSLILYRCNSLVMKPLGENLLSWNRHYTEFRLSGVASPCWLGVHHGLPKECYVMPWQTFILVLMKTANVDEESNRRDHQ